jgi:hypothetical protein
LSGGSGPLESVLANMLVDKLIEADEAIVNKLVGDMVQLLEGTDGPHEVLVALGHMMAIAVRWSAHESGLDPAIVKRAVLMLISMQVDDVHDRTRDLVAGLVNGI